MFKRDRSQNTETVTLTSDPAAAARTVAGCFESAEAELIREGVRDVPEPVRALAETEMRNRLAIARNAAAEGRVAFNGELSALEAAAAKAAKVAATTSEKLANAREKANALLAGPIDSYNEAHAAARTAEHAVETYRRDRVRAMSTQEDRNLARRILEAAENACRVEITQQRGTTAAIAARAAIKEVFRAQDELRPFTQLDTEPPEDLQAWLAARLVRIAKVREDAEAHERRRLLAGTAFEAVREAVA